MRCDYIAEGVIKATQELSLTIPLVVRLKGTKEEEAKECVWHSILHVNSLTLLQDDQEIGSENHCFRRIR